MTSVLDKAIDKANDPSSPSESLPNKPVDSTADSDPYPDSSDQSEKELGSEDESAVEDAKQFLDHHLLP
jgi:hypothetical protein